MATNREFLEYTLELFGDLPEITFRPMMGEYLLYYRGKLFGGLYDGRLLVKPVPSARALLPDAAMEEPYPGAKKMLALNSIEDRDLLMRLVTAMYDELPEPRPRRRKKEG